MYKYADFIGAHLKVVVVEPNGKSKDPTEILDNLCFNMVVSQELAKFQNISVKFLTDKDVEEDIRSIPCAGLVFLPCLGSTSEDMQEVVKTIRQNCVDTHIVVWDNGISKKEQKALQSLGAQHVFPNRNEAIDLKNMIEVIKQARPEETKNTLLSAN